MIFFIELLIIFVMAATLIGVYLDERVDIRRRMPYASVEEIWFGAERRRAIRIPSTLYVLYSRLKGKQAVITAYTENISTGGMKIIAEEKFMKGEQLVFEINLPNPHRPITAHGEVAWLDENSTVMNSGKRCFAAGIKFLQMKPDKEKELKKFIEGLITAV